MKCTQNLLNLINNCYNLSSSYKLNQRPYNKNSHSLNVINIQFYYIKPLSELRITNTLWIVYKHPLNIIVYLLRELLYQPVLNCTTPSWYIWHHPFIRCLCRCSPNSTNRPFPPFRYVITILRNGKLSARKTAQF